MRIGRNTLSFALPDPTDKDRPLRYEPYVVKGGISMAANLREALKSATLPSERVRRVQVVLDTPSMLVPIEQFEEDTINELYAYTFAPSEEQEESALQRSARPEGCVSLPCEQRPVWRDQRPL